jgi:hypothetical protein
MSIASQRNMEFTCPKCGSHRWGTHGPTTAGCHGKIFPSLEFPNMFNDCDFTWERSEDTKYFGPIKFKFGDMVRTAATLKRRDFTDDGVKNRQCGIQGIVVATHDSHGLCYDVRHFGKIGCYDPDELTRVPEQVRWVGVL